MNTSISSRFVIYAVGIFVCYFLHGYFQEKLTQGRYGKQVQKDGEIGERFNYSSALVWVQSACNCLFAKGFLIVKPQQEDTTKTGYYVAGSLTYLLAMVSSTTALRTVPYPAAVVGKSAKPIPVMILGVLIGRKSYSWTRYVCVFTIVLGVILFMYDENEKKKSKSSEKISLEGAALLLLSLFMDGLTGVFEDRIRATGAPSGHQMMLAMNFGSTLMLCVPIILTGEGKDFLSFVSIHPEALTDIALLSLCGALGQFFIFEMVVYFGALACSVVTTTRKCFTFLCSVLLVGHALMFHQWLGAILVFAALFVDMVYGKIEPKPTEDRTETN